MCKRNQQWLMEHRSELHTRADLQTWGSNLAPVLSVSPLMYARREKLGDLMCTCYLNNQWLLGLCVSVLGPIHREQERKKKHVAFEGLTFICGVMSHLQASHQQLFARTEGFLAPVSQKCKWPFPLFFSNKERNWDRVETLFGCHRTVTFLFISWPAGR